MYHSITYGTMNTWNDWHLIPTSRPVFDPPQVRTNMLDLPGADGSIDLALNLTMVPMFNNRSGAHEFVVMNGYLRWEQTYAMIANYLHGNEMRAVLEDDPEYFYEGSFGISDWKSSKSFSIITIDYTVRPYKKLLSNNAVASL